MVKKNSQNTNGLELKIPELRTIGLGHTYLIIILELQTPFATSICIENEIFFILIIIHM